MTDTSNRYLAGNFAPVHDEVTAHELRLTGSIPAELRGRLLRIGPNPLPDETGEGYHWFTGPGMVHGVRLRDGRAEWYRRRWVRSDQMTRFHGWPETPGPRHGAGDNTANTNVIGHAGRTYAIVEAGGLPIELTTDLETVRRADFDGTLGGSFTAHPKIGGGGKGMRIVRAAHEADEAIAAASREASRAFSDGTVYVERLIERPRHIEVQVMGDRHGHTVHLFERDCTLQRRHQKVIEEAPGPTVTPAIRDRMTRAAVAAAQAVGYVNAGTVEFLLAGDEFYFLEMNTRLQVEHPITEMITGVDLVRAQLLVASGEPLPFRQDDLSIRGHAVECRVYAEDPAHGFLPHRGACCATGSRRDRASASTPVCARARTSPCTTIR